MSGSGPWLGVNFWSRAGGPLMWRDYHADVVDGELAVLAAHRLTVTRSFFYWPDFMPESGRIDERMVANYARFLDQHVEHGLQTIPTFIVGHMSGENWDPAWRGDRDLYRDVWLVGRQAWFIRELTARFADHPAIAGWLISNEMPIYAEPETGGGAADREPVAAWAELMVQAVRAGGARQPVSLGDGAWGLEVTGRDNGYRIRDLAPLVDFVGPHVYPMGDDQNRQFLAAAFTCDVLGFAGRPVVLEEFGVSTAFVSAEHAGHYYRQVLHSTLLSGATGWLAWNNTDYEALAGQDPYRHHPFEMYFGVTDSVGVPKPPLTELRDFAEVLDAVDLPRCRRPTADTALVLSSYGEADHPMTDPADRPMVFSAVRHAWLAAWEADLPLAIVREADGITAGHRLYVVPSVKQLLAPSWTRLEELAAGGATVYVSYCGGTHSGQRGPWWAGMDRIFGVRHELRYGLVDPITEPEARLTCTADFGSLHAGDELTFAATGGTANSRAYLPVRPVDAEVLATDGHGRPALLRRAVGAGALILGTYPIEHLAATTPRVNPEDTWRLYDALAEHAGVARDVRVTDPRVHAATLRHEDGGSFVWLINGHDEELSVRPEGVSALSDVRNGAHCGARIPLPPYGVAVCRTESPP